jgi:hypothetical protein
MRLTKSYIFLFLSFFFICYIHAQEHIKTTPLILEGKDFWVAFEQNFKDPPDNDTINNIKLYFTITSSKDAKVKIEIPGLNFVIDTNVKAGSIRKISINPTCQVVLNEQPQNLGIHVTSDNPIMLYGVNHRLQSTETFTAVPVDYLGSEYRTMCYENSDFLDSQFAFLATEDNTSVGITPTFFRNGTKISTLIKTIKLNKGEIYQVAASTRPDRPQPQGEKPMDITCTYLNGTHNFAVFSGHQCAYVPNGVFGCNHIVEQMIPINLWGSNFFIGSLRTRSKSTIRIMSATENNTLTVNSKWTAELEAGEFYEISDQIEDCIIETSGPALVTQYGQGFRNGDSIGDPMMLIVRPDKDFQKSYRFATPVEGNFHHYINISVPTDAIETVKLDGYQVDNSLFKPYPNSNYMIAKLEVKFGSHFIECVKPFGIYSYGFGFGKDEFDAYGNM